MSGPMFEAVGSADAELTADDDIVFTHPNVIIGGFSFPCISAEQWLASIPQREDES